MYEEWKLLCQSPTNGKSVGFMQRTWWLPEQHILVVDNWQTKGLYEALKNATWQ